jgi:trk system potassium uptake protein TrkH
LSDSYASDLGLSVAIDSGADDFYTLKRGRFALKKAAYRSLGVDQNEDKGLFAFVRLPCQALSSSALASRSCGCLLRRDRGVIAFALTSLVTLAAGIVLSRLETEEEMGIKEGLALVALGWLGAAIFGALPYVLLGTSVVDGLFESMSGFTTTGSSILMEYNAQGYWILNQTLANQSLASTLEAGLRQIAFNSSILQIRKESYFGLLFWRSLSQWLGGMGIILLFIAILPRLGVAGRSLYRAEVPGPEKDALTPRIKQTARMLWWVYVMISFFEVVLLKLAGMPLYDSLCNTSAQWLREGYLLRLVA